MFRPLCNHREVVPHICSSDYGLRGLIRDAALVRALLTILPSQGIGGDGSIRPARVSRAERNSGPAIGSETTHAGTFGQSACTTSAESFASGVSRQLMSRVAVTRMIAAIHEASQPVGSAPHRTTLVKTPPGRWPKPKPAWSDAETPPARLSSPAHGRP